MDVVKLDLWFRRAISFTAFFFGVIQFILNERNIWIDAGFVISMAGVVGYYTNFLAIKMLFQPKKGKVLGWEGLVPKNKANIAKSLGESIQTNLLAPDILLEYVYERKLIEKGTVSLSQWLDELIDDEKFRNRTTAKIISVLQEKGPDFLSGIFNFTEDTLKELAKNPEEIKKVWASIREKIIEYLHDRKNREYLAQMIRIVLLEELPKLSLILNNAIDTYLKQTNTLAGFGLGIKKVISFDNVALQNVLQKFIEEEDTSDHLMGVLDLLAIELQNKLSSPETQEFILSKVSTWVEVSSNYSRQELLPMAINRLKAYLDDRKNWKKVGDYSFQFIDYAKDKLIDYMRSPEGSEYLKVNIAKVIQKVNVTNLVEEQVMKLDTDELEKMILDNTGGNLVVIQFLGGILGIIAGFIQVHIYFSVPVLTLVLVTYVAYKRNQKLHGLKD
ncbi:MAG: DUF445 family protein [Leptospiraceae bacterium]|nr:DUF445 family protein [Leptospiraceae bacterium]MCP5512566.1 DUF445 family protein [Leptospiraceae bacterium]